MDAEPSHFEVEPESPRSARVTQLSSQLAQLMTLVQPVLAAYAASVAQPVAPAPLVQPPPPPPVPAPPVPGLKPNKPPPYDGNARSNIKAWLDAVRTYFLTVGLSPPFATQQAVIWAAGFLVKTAQDWWIARKQQSEDNIAGGFTAFDGPGQFAEALSSHFADPNPEATADAKLARMSLADYKGTFAIRSFCADFQKLSLDLPKRHSRDFVRDFVRKLASNKPLLEHMAVNYPSSLQDAIDRAIFFDSLVNSNPTVTDALKSLGRPRAGAGPQPMELGSAEASTSQRPRNPNSKCNYCKEPGHWKDECPKLRRKLETADPKGKRPASKN